MNRFIVIVEDRNHAVVDTTRKIRLCSCCDVHIADMIADALNDQRRETFSKLMGKEDVAG